MRKITRLTSEQEAAIPGWVEKWIAEGLRTDEADWEKAEQGMRECYAHAHIPFPAHGLFHVQSPLATVCVIKTVSEAAGEAVDKAVHEAAHKIIYKAIYLPVNNVANKVVNRAIYRAVYWPVYEAVRMAVYDPVYKAVDKAVDADLMWQPWYAGQFWLAWQAYEKFFQDICGLKLSLDNQAASYEMTQKNCSYWLLCKDFILIYNRPAHIGRNTLGQLHATDRMAIEYRDGWGLWMLNGIEVSKNLVMTPAHDLDPTLIMTEKNAEIRREIVRKIGIERLLTKLKAKVLDKRGDYELLQLPKIEGMAIVPTYLKMRNPSLGVWHVEGVPPTVKTVQQALNARAGKLLSAGDWMPEQLT